jgi:lysophospholipase L1-like esterase
LKHHLYVGLSSWPRTWLPTVFLMWGSMFIGLSPAHAAPAAQTLDPRVQAVMQRLDAGQPITVVAMGGSITTGYATQPPREKGWAAQVAAWLAQRGKVKFVNAGVSGTDSTAAVQRVKAHVLSAAPDLVLLEFGVNDAWLAPAVRQSSYEGLLRQLLGAAKPPAVLPLLLTQEANQMRGAVDVQLRLAQHYGLTTLDFGNATAARAAAGAVRWADWYDEPVHPNQRGHDAIAQIVISTLQSAAQAGVLPSPSGRPAPVPAPLFGRTHESVHSIADAALVPWRNQGFSRGGDVHAEWAQLPGGQTAGWTTRADDAEASFLVWGSQIAIFHSESEHYRNLEAWVDDGPVVTLHGYQAERKGYLGWHTTVVGDGLESGAHLLHVRVKRDAFAGSGRSAGLTAIWGAGVNAPAVQAQKQNSNQLQTQLQTQTQTASTLLSDKAWRPLPPSDPHLRYVGRIDNSQPDAPLLSWSGSEIRARFTGARLALRMLATRGSSFYTVEVDGRSYPLALRGEGMHVWQLPVTLSGGEHSFRLRKRTEASMAEARFLGLMLAQDGKLLQAPAARALRIEFYGDSITAGACNGDLGTDQYEDLSTHDGTRAYGALVAERLHADYVGIAVSGIGITRTWDTLLMPQVWNRYAPRLDAAIAPATQPGARAPDVVVVNLGQNDHGFPASRGEPFAADFAPRYLSFVRELRKRYPQAKLVLTLGGMSAWKEQPALGRALADTVNQLAAEGDRRVWHYRFNAMSDAHPRIDVHALMADELQDFLQSQVLPQKQRPAGMRVQGQQLLEDSGKVFIPRGINHAHTWFRASTAQALADIAATGANTVRVVLSDGQQWPKVPVREVRQIIAQCKANQLICMLEVHDATGSGDQKTAGTVAKMARYWAELAPTLKGHEQHVLINIANEPFGNSASAAEWITAHQAAIRSLRRLGLAHSIVVDAPAWGQDHNRVMLDNAQAVADADMLRNTVFSVHMYEVYTTREKVEGYLTDFLAKNKLPILVGEFGVQNNGKPVDVDSILAVADRLQVGYLGWSWSGNGQSNASLDLVQQFKASQRSAWGERLIRGAHGLQHNAVRASVFDKPTQAP